MFVTSIAWRTRTGLQTLSALNKNYDIEGLTINDNLLG